MLGLNVRMGLRAKIIAWFLVPTALILGAVALLAYRTSQQGLAELVMSRNTDRTRLLANQLAASLQAYRMPLARLADGSLVPGAEQAVLEAAWPNGGLSIFDAGVLMLDADGQVIAAAPQRKAVLGARIPLPDASGAPPGPDDLGFSDLIGEPNAGIQVIAVCYPLSDPKGPLQTPSGAIVGLFNATRVAARSSEFYRTIWQLYNGRRQNAYLVDACGRVIFHPDTFLTGDDFSKLLAVQRALAGEADAVRTRDDAGRDVIAAFAPVPGTTWALVTEEPWDEITAASRSSTRMMLALLALGVIVPVGAVATGVRRVTAPISELTAAAQDIAGGNLGRTIEVRTGDELETLAGRFNAMSSELQASYELLERRVAARTRELATLNAITTVVGQSLDLDEVMATALRETIAALDAPAGASFRCDHGELCLVAHEGLPENLVTAAASIPLPEDLPLQPSMHAVAALPEGELRNALLETGWHSVLSVPLTAHEKMLGVLCLLGDEQRALAPEQASLLAAIGRQTGVAVENARLYAQAEVAAAAAERTRLARDLHDAVSQTLFSASLIADVLPRLYERNPAAARERLEALRRLTRGATAEMRALLWELRPAALEQVGLDELLSQLGRAVAGRSPVEVQLDVAPVPVPADVKVALYRIAQEALSNVVKHSGAQRVTVAVAADGGTITLSVTDDGRGFAPTEIVPGHFGLGNMRERAASVGARFTLESSPDAGTSICVQWPGEEQS